MSRSLDKQLVAPLPIETLRICPTRQKKKKILYVAQKHEKRCAKVQNLFEVDFEEKKKKKKKKLNYPEMQKLER